MRLDYALWSSDKVIRWVCVRIYLQFEEHAYNVVIQQHYAENKIKGVSISIPQLIIFKRHH